MRVLFYHNHVINCTDNDPQIDRLVKAGAEDVPIEIFGGYPNFATSENTEKVDGTWTFTADKEALAAEEAEIAKAAQIADIDAQLATIDAASSRPLRSILTATQAGADPDQADVDQLADLEAQAETLRTQRAALAVA